MKTKNPFAKAVVVAALLVLSLCTASLRAQVIASCPYYIINNTNCPIEVSYEVLDVSAGTCNSTCGSAIFVTIPPGPGTFITISCCQVGNDVSILLNQIGACWTGFCAAGASNVVNGGNGGGGPCVALGNTATYDATCCPGAQNTITWGPNQCTID